MQNKRTYFLFVLTGLILVLGSGIWLATATPASAQCGCQASSSSVRAATPGGR